MATVITCAGCGKSTGIVAQESLPGLPQFCINCQTKSAIRYILAMLPEEESAESDALTIWEWDFLASVRDQFERKGKLTEKQYQILERIYIKLR